MGSDLRDLPPSRRIMMPSPPIAAPALLLVSLTVAAQQPPVPAQPPGQAAGARAGRMMAHPPKAVTHNGHPAIEYEGAVGSAYIDYFMHQGEPALGFTMAQDQCPGHVYVTRTRIGGDFRGTPCQSFDLQRQGTTAERQAGQVVLTSGGASYTLVPQVERGEERRAAPRAQVSGQILIRAVTAFGKTFANVRRLALEAQAQEPGQNPQGASPTAQMPAQRKAGATLTLHSDPGDTQVYINDQPRGMTDAEGSEVIHLPPGSYRVRLSLPGYEDFVQAVTLAPGGKQEITAKLQEAGPPPFTADDVSEMLHGKMSPKRIATLVQERGVDFALNPEVEKRLRGLGAT